MDHKYKKEKLFLDEYSLLQSPVHCQYYIHVFLLTFACLSSIAACARDSFEIKIGLRKTGSIKEGLLV